MQANDYQKEALRTAARKNGKNRLILNGVLGLNGEAGEVADVLKKHLFQGHELNIEELIEELGDVCWYVAILSEGLGVSLEEVMQRNIDKLKDRYPNGFDAQKSIYRDEKDAEYR